MAPKTTKRLINDALEDLTERNFDKFRNALLNRKEEPRVKRNQVEGKDYLVVTDVLVSTFTEAGALAMVVELLREIRCNEEAEQIEKEIGEQTSNPGSSDTVRPSAGAEGGCSSGEHFVDKHSDELIDRVNGIASILDQLLNKKVISQDAYDDILVIPNKREKMRKLLYGPLLSAGPEGKEIFYKILEKKEPFLVAELKNKK